MIRILLPLLMALLLGSPAMAQPPPPALEGYRFFAFLDVTVEVEEPLPTVIRREMPELPQAWYEVEKYIASYYPNAFTAPRSRILKQGVSIRLPMYRKPSELVVLAPPPPPAPEPAPLAKPQESIVGALVTADNPVQVEGSLGQRSELAAVDNVRRGDTITTDAKTEASLRLLDGTTILLRTGSSVLLKEFRFASKDGNSGVLNLKLLKGGMRTISGMIPKNKASQYALETPKATMTVRGTDYAVRLCEAGDNCQIDGEAAAEGLYAGVLEGGIDLGNASGSSPAEAGDIVRVETPEASAVPAPEAASLVFNEEELKLLPVKRGSCMRSVGGGDSFNCGR
ncbi:MAG: FecR family protein [Pseudomonadota bacterium]